ncbi:MAG: SusD/RagB family nutrient-binding outer membrane lipoprotein [Bacteroidota bacterium]
MKKIYLKLWVTIFAGATFFLSSCSKKIDEAYTNPNAFQRVPVESLLPGIIGNFVGNSSAQGSAYGIANDGRFIGRYIQYWFTNSSGSSAPNIYDQMAGAIGASDDLGSIWAMHYYGMGQNLQRMIQWSKEEKKWDYAGVGHAILAWSWLTMTNTYGDAILKQAFEIDRYIFTYETQEEIYKECRKQAHLAISYLNQTGDNVSQANLALGDAYFYGGDREKWKKFAYSVLARSFNHLTNKSIYQPDSVIAYANLGINSVSDNATAKFQASGLSGTFNFFGPFRGNMGVLRQSRFIANLLSGTNPIFLGVTDPRAPYIIRENTNGTYRGILPNTGLSGLGTAEVPQSFWGVSSFTSTAAPGTDETCRYIFRNGSPFPIITAAEIHFMKAEAFLRKGPSFSAQARQSYIDGINASFDMLVNTPDYQNSVPAPLQITSSSRAAYFSNPLVVPAAGSLTRSHIMLQKYIAMYGYGLVETWVDLRRYHYTDLDPATGQQVYAGFTLPTLFTNNATKSVYRARPRYNSEYLYNIAALNSVGGLSLDYHTKEQWFSLP